MTGCGAGPACLHDHVFPYLRGPLASGADSYRAYAPCHDDRTRSLSVSYRNGRVIWRCFACAKTDPEHAQERTRDALIRRCGVSPRCLIRASEDAQDFEQAAAEIVFGNGKAQHKVLLLAALLRGFGGELPHGGELEALAADCGVSRAEAYRARAEPR